MKFSNAIIVGGPIAVGKSTLLGSLPYKSIQELEHNDKLQDILLERMYLGNKDAAITFQLDILCSRFKKYKSFANSEDICIFDRSILEDIIFAEALLKENQNDFNYYHSIWKDKVDDIITNIGKPFFYIILDFDWETFKKRIFARNRVSEVKNFEKNKSYFKILVNSYRSKIEKLCQKFKIKYIVIDTKKLNSKEVINKVKSELNKIGVFNGS